MQYKLTEETISLNASANSKEEATRMAGHLLVKGGYIDESYIDGMLAREKSMSTYIGNGVAIPHGQFDDLTLVHRTGISVLQIRDGVTWEGDEKAYLIIGIASNSDDHINILANLAEAIEDPATAKLLAETSEVSVVLDHLNAPNTNT
ncbi:MAG: phosphoenolpyruvate-dependent sugar phosphotransferase system EIIA 2 [Anaerolineaceae bacterium]|nr:phosphoenolpyruvate-dependent sugar phosphotransferase system EIIA 2 [Anaerolineaceae bacterium]MBS60796.1 phosphoenolpyruvate-dependent sugar phosphotransferase system EIIA 2 [Anaerolineaceae bacterium]|tara:strand:+ start:34281 stop:34724 length:444 start_codon:yes stop_codon:yes gene_type:complete